MDAPVERNFRCGAGAVLALACVVLMARSMRAVGRAVTVGA